MSRSKTLPEETMLPYVYLICCVFFAASLSLFASAYNKKNESRKHDCTPLYNLIYVLCVVIAWAVIWATDFSFDIKVMPYSILFAIGYAAAIMGLIISMKNGPMALTSLIFQLSIVATSVWGFFFWDSPVTLPVILGLVLVFLSLFFCLYTKKKEGEKGVSLKWLICVGITFISNGAISIIQRQQPIDFNKQHSSMMMFFGTFFAFIIILIAFLKSNKSEAKEVVKTSGFIPVLSGVCNVLMNLFIIRLATSKLSPSLIYPTIGVGGIIITTLFSVIALKEKKTPMQWIGILFGAAATVLLSI